MCPVRSRSRTIFLQISLVALVAVSGSIGCASVRSFGPGDNLAPREGLLVIHIRTRTPLAAVHIEGAGRILLDGKAGTQMIVVAVSAGSYRWSSLELAENLGPGFGNRFGNLEFRFPDQDELRFRVEQGRINYVGMVDVYRAGILRVGMRAIDRTAIALEVLRAQFPEFVARYPIAYSGPARNVFLERYLAAKGASEPTAAGANAGERR